MKTLKTFVFCLVAILVCYNSSFSQDELSPPANVNVIPLYIDHGHTIFNPLVTWDSVDGDCVYYDVYRARLTPGNDSTYYYIGSTSSINYLDQQITLYVGPGGSGICEYYFTMYAYKVKAIDECAGESSELSLRDTISGYTDPCAPESRPKMNFNGSSDKYLLNQNFPNPFNPTTTIAFSIPNNEFVSLKVYDLSGKEVARLVDNNLTSGSYKIDFNASKLASGVYIYKLITKNYSSIKRMILVK